MPYVLIDQVDAQHHLPVAQPFHIFERHVPSAAAVSFAQDAPPPELVGYAPHLLHRPDIPELRAGALFIELVEQHVDPRNLLPRGHRHVVRNAGHQRPVMLPVVPRPRNPFPGTVIVPRPGPALDKQAVEQLEIVVTHLSPIPDFLVQLRQAVAQIITVLATENVEQIGRPTHAAGRHDLGFVGKNALYISLQVASERLFVTLHRDLHEFVGHPVRQQVDIRPAGIPRRRLVKSLFIQVKPARPSGHRSGPIGNVFEFTVLLGDDHEIFRNIGGHRIGRRRFQALSLVERFRHLARHMPAGETARVGIFVVKPHFESQIAPLVHRIFHHLVPRRRQVLGNQSEPRMDKYAAAALFLIFGKDTVDPVRRNLGVPHHKRLGAELAAGIGELIEKPLRRLRVGSVLRVGSSADGKHQRQDGQVDFFHSSNICRLCRPHRKEPPFRTGARLRLPRHGYLFRKVSFSFNLLTTPYDRPS